MQLREQLTFASREALGGMERRKENRDSGGLVGFFLRAFGGVSLGGVGEQERRRFWAPTCCLDSVLG